MPPSCLCFFHFTLSETMETPTRWRSFCLLPRRRGRSSTPSMWPPLGRRVHPKSIGSQLCSSSGKGVSRIRSVISPTQQRAFGEDDLFKNRLWNSNTHRGAFPSRSPAAGEENSSIPFGTSQVDFGSYPKISRSTFPPQTQTNLQPRQTAEQVEERARPRPIEGNPRPSARALRVREREREREDG